VWLLGALLGRRQLSRDVAGGRRVERAQVDTSVRAGGDTTEVAFPVPGGVSCAGLLEGR
jgi:hypothetical protein